MNHTIAVYVRSTTIDDESINSQIATIMERVIKDYDGEPVRIYLYMDNGYSVKQSDCPGYKAMLEEADMDEEVFDALYVTDYTRIARNMSDLHDLVRITEGFKINLRAVNNK